MMFVRVCCVKTPGHRQEEGRQCPTHANASHGDECYGDDAPDGQGACLPWFTGAVAHGW